MSVLTDPRPGSVYLTFPWDAPAMAQQAAVALALRGYQVHTRMTLPEGTFQQWEVVGHFAESGEVPS